LGIPFVFLRDSLGSLGIVVAIPKIFLRYSRVFLRYSFGSPAIFFFVFLSFSLGIPLIFLGYSSGIP